MDWAIALTVFPIIAVGELPDKTMFASLVLSTKACSIADSMRRITWPPSAVRNTSVSSSKADWFRVIV
jgi:hypothetical protein